MREKRLKVRIQFKEISIKQLYCHLGAKRKTCN